MLKGIISKALKYERVLNNHLIAVVRVQPSNGVFFPREISQYLDDER